LRSPHGSNAWRGEEPNRGRPAACLRGTLVHRIRGGVATLNDCECIRTAHGRCTPRCSGQKPPDDLRPPCWSAAHALLASPYAPILLTRCAYQRPEAGKHALEAHSFTFDEKGYNT